MSVTIYSGELELRVDLESIRRCQALTLSVYGALCRNKAEMITAPEGCQQHHREKGIPTTTDIACSVWC